MCDVCVCYVLFDLDYQLVGSVQNRVIVSSSFFWEDSGWVGGWMLVCYPKREQAKLTFEVNL